MSYTTNDRNTRFIISGGTTASPTNLSQKRLYPTDPGMLDVQALSICMEHLRIRTWEIQLTHSVIRNFSKTIVDSGGTDTIDGSSQTEEVWINLNGGIIRRRLAFGMRQSKLIIGLGLVSRHS